MKPGILCPFGHRWQGGLVYGARGSSTGSASCRASAHPSIKVLGCLKSCSSFLNQWYLKASCLGSFLPESYLCIFLTATRALRASYHRGCARGCV